MSRIAIAGMSLGIATAFIICACWQPLGAVLAILNRYAGHDDPRVN